MPQLLMVSVLVAFGLWLFLAFWVLSSKVGGGWKDASDNLVRRPQAQILQGMEFIHMMSAYVCAASGSVM